MINHEERSRILRMVAEGKVSAEEAAELLEALEPPRTEPVRPAAPLPPPVPSTAPQNSRVLHIEVDEGGESRVNIRIPLGLARAASRFIPRQAQRHLEGYDIDLEQLVTDLAGVTIEGPLIEVHDDEDRVIIAIE